MMVSRWQPSACLSRVGRAHATPTMRPRVYDSRTSSTISFSVMPMSQGNDGAWGLLPRRDMQ